MKRSFILLTLFVLPFFGHGQSNAPNVIDGRISSEVEQVPQSGYDTTFSVLWDLELTDSSNIDEVRLSIRELNSSVPYFQDTLDYDSVGTSPSSRPYRDGLMLYLQRGVFQGGKRCEYEVVFVDPNGNPVPDPFRIVR